MKPRITQSDIAECAGVSVATVSRVLSNDPRVSAHVKERVQAVIADLGYVSTARRRHTRSNGDLVGIVVPNVQNPYFSLLIKGIENVARIHGYSVILADSQDDIDIENDRVSRLVDIGVQGLVFIPVKGRNHEVAQLVKTDFPVVFLDRCIDLEGICSVTVDNQEGAYQATKYLIGLGHKDIVYVRGSTEVNTEGERHAGFIRAMEEASLTVSIDATLDGDYDFQKTYEAVSALIERRHSFTAMFATSDIMALGAMKAFRENNIRIPDDVSLVGYDDIVFSSIVALTTVYQPKYELGRNAIIMLIDLMHKKISPPSRIVLNPSMVIRATARRLPERQEST